MPVPAQFHLQVVHGIVGGFVAPNPQSSKAITYTGETLQISTSSTLNPIHVKKDDLEDVDELVEELQSILKTIPTEDPPGSEDIYGFDTSIMWGSDEFEWRNSGAQGCGGFSEVKASDEDKVKFKRALEIAETLVAKGLGSSS